MIEQIEVNGENLDLFPESRVNLNLRISTIGDIGTRNSSFSNTISIPRTAKNQRLLEHAGVLGHRSTFPYTENRVRYSRGNVTLIRDGVIRLKETLPFAYKVFILDGVIDFSSALGSKTLRDLTYNEEIHYLNTQTVASSFGNTEGYIYALASFGKDVGNASFVEIQSQLPSIFAHTIWDKIFDQNGFRYSGDFFTSNTEWKNLIVLPAEGIDNETGGAEVETPTGGASSDTINKNDTYGSSTTEVTQHNLTSDTFTADLTRTAGGDIQVNFTGNLRLELTNTFTIGGTPLTTVKFRVKNNGTIVSQYNLFSGSPIDRSVTLAVTSGDIITFDVEAITTYDYQNQPQTQWDIVYTSSFTVDGVKITGGVQIDPVTFVPEIEQQAFVKDILQRYGLLMIKNRLDPQEYRFVQLEELLDDRAGAVDWTDKLIAITSQRYESGYAQSNVGTYVYTDGVSPSQDGKLLVTNENAPVEKTIIGSPYQIPIASGITKNSQILYQNDIWKVNDDLSVENNQAKEKLMRKNLDTGDITLRKAGTGSLLVTDPVAYASLENMSYQYFFDNYFVNFGALLNGYKEIEAEVDLDDVDLNNLDLFKLVYLQQTGQFYYIDTVRTGGRAPRAKLIEIPTFNN